MATIKEKAAKAEKAVETEVKKTTRRAKAAVEEVKDAAAATEIEVKKTARKATRTVKAKAEEVKAAAEKPARKAKTAKLDIMIQSPMGGNITPEEIAAKLPEGAESVFVRVDHNKLYWVRGEETGEVDIW